MTKVVSLKSAPDLNLLFGIAAVQLHLVLPTDLKRAAAACSLDPSREIGAVLVEMRLIQEQDRALINQLLEHGFLSPLGEALAALLDRGKSEAAIGSPRAEDAVPAGMTSPLLSFGGAVPEQAIAGKSPSERLDDTESITLEQPGRYAIKSEHGRGGIGRVLIAFDQHIGREVALKELLLDRAVSGSRPNQSPMQIIGQATARFLRESRITGQLEHPGIVPVYEIAKRLDGTLYYTMKLVRGNTLADRLAKCQGLSERLRLITHFLDLCQAIAYAHSKGVIHRDLKPANVMVGEFGETVVLDWGLAKVRGLEDVRAEEIEDGLRLIKEAGSGETAAGQAMGTPSYMSPEQAEGKVEEMDERSDVWGLGAILYELLTGRPPFLGDLAYEVIGKVMSAELEPASQVEPNAPPELCAIAEKCLQRDRALRYPSARELAEDMARFQAGGLVSAYEYSMTALLGRWVKKSWPAVMTGAVALVLVTILGAWSFLRIREERNLALTNEGKAQQQEALAEKREQEANANLLASYLILGRLKESKKAMNSAAIYYAQALSLRENPVARFSLNYVRTIPAVSGRLERVLEGHQNNVIDVAISPDGKTIASSSRDGTVKLWDKETGKLIRSLPANSDWMGGIAFLADGKRIASGSSDALIKIWEIETGKLLLTLSGHTDYIYSVAVSPDGKTMASGSDDKTIKLWDLQTGRLIHTLTGHTQPLLDVVFSPDGKVLVSAGRDGTVRLWDPVAGKLIRALTGHTDLVAAVAVSPDGKTIVSGGRDRKLKFWDLATGAPLIFPGAHEDWTWSLAFSPDGKILASASEDQTVKLWDPATGKIMLSLEGHNDWATSVAFSPDGKTLVSGSGDNTVRIWRVSEERLFSSREGLPGPAISVAFGPEDRPLAVIKDQGTVRLRDFDAGRDRFFLEGQTATITAARLSPDMKTLASGSNDGTLKLWDCAKGNPLFVWSGHREAINEIAFSADGKTIASASNDKTVKIWDSVSGSMRLSLEKHTGPALCVAISPDGRILASGGKDNLVMIWDAANGRLLQVCEGHFGPVISLAFSPDGKVLATGSLDHSVKLWDPSSGALLRALSGHVGRVLGLAFFPDNKILASASSDASVKLWETASGKLLHSLEENTDWVIALAVSPDGKFLASGSLDNTIKVWPFLPELLTGQPKKLLDQAEKTTGLLIKGTDLYPWNPNTGKVSTTPIAISF